jgi:hypothetical protein
MIGTSLRSQFDGWRIEAPWAEWTRRRRVMVALLFVVPILVGGLAFLGAFSLSWCGVWGGECTPEEEHGIAVLSTVVLVNYVVVLAGLVAMFVLRRRVFWLVAAVLGVIGLVDAMV